MRSFAHDRAPHWCAVLTGLAIVVSLPAQAQPAPTASAQTPQAIPKDVPVQGEPVEPVPAQEQGDVGSVEQSPAPISAPPPEPAQEVESAENPLETRADVGFAIAAKVGGGIGKPVSEFGGTPAFELELEYMLPLSPPIGHSLGFFLAGQYAQPGFDGSADPDSRLPGNGVLDYELGQQQLVLSLGARYRFDVGSDLLMPYAGIGGRLYMLRTMVKGEVDGERYGENEETDGSVGLLVQAGLDVFLGPGALLAELQFGWGSVDAYVLRDTSVGAFTLLVGYRFVL
jgi:hypothetical protein